MKGEGGGRDRMTIVKGGGWSLERQKEEEARVVPADCEPKAGWVRWADTRRVMSSLPELQHCAKHCDAVQ